MLLSALVLQAVLPADHSPSPAPQLAPRRPRAVVAPIVSDYPAILRAPVFAPDRQPAVEEHSASPAGGPLAAFAALGVVTDRSHAAAVVSGPGGKVQTLHPGDEIDGWRLVAVARNELTFDRNGVRHELLVGAPAAAPPGPSQTPDDAAAPGGQ